MDLKTIKTTLCIDVCVSFGVAALSPKRTTRTTGTRRYFRCRRVWDKSYIFVILKTGSARLDDKQQISALFRGHLENINRLVEQKKLIVAGPFGKNERGYRGLFIFDSKDKVEVEAMLQTDPAIKEKLLEAELFD